MLVLQDLSFMPPGSDQSTPLHLLSPQYWTEQVSWNYAQINEWPLTKGISAPGVLVHISVLKKSVHDAPCVVTTHLQEDYSVIIHHRWPITPFHTLASQIQTTVKEEENILKHGSHIAFRFTTSTRLKKCFFWTEC